MLRRRLTTVLSHVVSNVKRGSKTMATPALQPKSVKIPVTGKEDLTAVYFKNDKNTKGVIVLQEWWGMNEQIQGEAKTIAKEGNFTTIVPDLYRGKLATDNEEANHLMSTLDWQGAIADIRACANFLLEEGCLKVGVTGFCMGGALSMAAAGKIPEITAAAPFYGICGDQLCDPQTITKPLQCHFGSKDAVEGFSCPKSQEKLKEKLNAGNVPYEFHTYDAGHAFTNESGPLGTYDKEACKLALDRMYKFFNEKLN